MHRPVRLTAVWIAVASATALGGDAGAEGFVEVRGGAAFTSDGNVTVSGSGVGLGGKTRFDDSGTVGLRGGYWFDFDFLRWLGFAADLSWFGPHTAGADIHVIPITPMVMFRLPLLTSDELPAGRLQPYTAIGPGIFTTVVHQSATDFTAAGVDVGLDVRAGLNVQILKWLAVFTEYRFTAYEAEVEDDFSGLKAKAKLDLDTHHIAAGVGFHF